MLITIHFYFTDQCFFRIGTFTYEDLQYLGNVRKENECANYVRKIQPNAVGVTFYPGTGICYALLKRSPPLLEHKSWRFCLFKKSMFFK